MKYYAGIGSRNTPKDIQELFSKVAEWLTDKGYTLRSGHAEGSDQAFENGCDKTLGNKEVYLPWKNFEGSDSELIVSNPKAFEIAKKHHPYWHNLKQGARKLQARNSHQVLGEDLETPSDFVICYTKKGGGEGGTGQAIRIAKSMSIPIFDAGEYSDIEQCKRELHSFLIKHMK